VVRYDARREFVVASWDMYAVLGCTNGGRGCGKWEQWSIEMRGLYGEDAVMVLKKLAGDAVRLELDG